MVILAVVLIIAVIGVSMLGFVPGMSADSRSASSNAYWADTAAPIGIKSATYAPGTVCGSANKGGYLMVVQNKNPESVVLKGMDIDGQSAQFCEPGASTPASEIYISAGYDKPVIVMTSTATTPSGTAVENMVRFKYSKTPLGPVYVEEGTAALVSDYVKDTAFEAVVAGLSGSASGSNATSCKSSGQSCSSSNDCCSGLKCWSGGSGLAVCISCVSSGSGCSTDDSCCSGLRCLDDGHGGWQCASALKAAGQICTSNSECASGNCVMASSSIWVCDCAGQGVYSWLAPCCSGLVNNANTCVLPGSGGGGQICTSNGDCAGGICSSYSTGTPKVCGCIPDGMPYSNPSNCCNGGSNEICGSGGCVNTGYYCDGGTPCCSGSCSNAACGGCYASGVVSNIGDASIVCCSHSYTGNPIGWYTCN